MKQRRAALIGLTAMLFMALAGCVGTVPAESSDDSTPAVVTDPVPSDPARATPSTSSPSTGATVESTAVEARESPAGPDITGINLCVWTHMTLASIDGIYFGGSDVIASAASEQEVRWFDDEVVVSCELSATILGDKRTVGEVTLISGGEPVAGAPQRGASVPFPVGDHEGISVTVDVPGAALAAVQLEPGLVLGVEGFNPSNYSAMADVASGGVRPLAAMLAESWDEGTRYRLEEGTYQEAYAFCDSLDLRGLPGQPDLQAIRVAAGSDNLTMQTLGTDIAYLGAVSCELVTAPGEPGDIDLWPWNNPFGKESSSLSYTFLGYSEPALAQAVAARVSSATDCSGIVDVGSDATVCFDGSGMASRQAVVGPWLVRAELHGNGVAFTTSDFANAARDIDDTIADLPDLPILATGYRG